MSMLSSNGVLNASFTTYSNDDHKNEFNRNTMQTPLNNFANKYVVLNPGPGYEIEPQDVCIYISLVKEENYNWKAARTKICKNSSFFRLT